MQSQPALSGLNTTQACHTHILKQAEPLELCLQLRLLLGWLSSTSSCPTRSCPTARCATASHEHRRGRAAATCCQATSIHAAGTIGRCSCQQHGSSGCGRLLLLLLLPEKGGP
jgi:hypothetical protein